MRTVGVTSRGIRLPILKTGDDLASEVVKSLLAASKEQGFAFHDRDVVAITESIVARTQGNYCSIDNIASDVIIGLGVAIIVLTFDILFRLIMKFEHVVPTSFRYCPIS